MCYPPDNDMDGVPDWHWAVKLALVVAFLVLVGFVGWLTGNP